MPLFDFVCKKCQHRFEELVSPDETPLCPECQGQKVQRQLPVFAVNGGSSAPPPMPGPCGACPEAGTGACGMN